MAPIEISHTGVLQPLLIGEVLKTRVEDQPYYLDVSLMDGAVGILLLWLQKPDNTVEEKTVLIDTLLELAQPYREVYGGNAGEIIMNNVAFIANELPEEMNKKISKKVALTAAQIGQTELAVAIATYKHPELKLSTSDREAHELVDKTILAAFVRDRKFDDATKYARDSGSSSYSLIRLAFLVENQMGYNDIESKRARLLAKEGWVEILELDTNHKINALKKLAGIQLDCLREKQARRTLHEALTLIKQQLVIVERSGHRQGTHNHGFGISVWR